MLLPILSLFAFQTAPMPAPRVSPQALPWFQSQVRSAIAAINQRKYAEAREIVNRLPSDTLTITWDLKGVPKEKQAIYNSARDKALSIFEIMPHFKIKLAPGGDLKIGFSGDVLRDDEGRDFAPTAIFRSMAPNDPPTEAIIAMKRGQKQKPATAADIHNEVAYAITQALGVAPVNDKLSVTYRISDSENGVRRITNIEGAIAAANIKTANTLREAIARQTTFDSLPDIQLSLEPRQFKLPEAHQGDIVETSMTVSNTGSNIAHFRVLPECGCFLINYSGDLKPGETHVVKIKIDTTQYVGDFAKKLHFYSDDPDKTAIDIPVMMWIEPRVQLVDPERRKVIVVKETGLVTTFYALFGKGVKPTLSEPELVGTGGVVKLEPWKGKIVDPLVGGAPVEREGYKITVLFSSSSITSGRSPFSLKFTTDDPKIPTVEGFYLIQKGIASTPATIHFGEIANQVASASSTLSKPGQPFKIKGVKTDNSSLKATYENLSGDEWRITVHYDGKGDSGPIAAKVIVSTDDPDQPEVEVAISGKIR